MPPAPLSLAYYLPQFHAIAENDAWWGAGFTEWRHLRHARRHYRWQRIRRPVPPLGQYSLLDGATIELQHRIASDHGIDGFFIWDYWFGNGRRLLERPAQLILEQDLRVRYCFAWANHAWLDKRNGRLLQAQHYLGREDYRRYFYAKLPHFWREGYIRVEGRPVLGVFKPADIPDLPVFVETLQELAIREGLPGLYLLADNTHPDSPQARWFERCYDSSAFLQRHCLHGPLDRLRSHLARRWQRHGLGPVTYDYRRMAEVLTVAHPRQLPILLTGWDTTPRHGERGVVTRHFGVETLRAHLRHIGEQLERQAGPPLLIIKSWNEWAEGNLLEPDDQFGYRLLETYRDWLAEREARPQRSLPEGFRAERPARGDAPMAPGRVYTAGPVSPDEPAPCPKR